MDTDEMKKIALSACIEMLGEALVMQHKDLCLLYLWNDVGWLVPL